MSRVQIISSQSALCCGFVRFRLMNLCHPLVVVKCYSSSGSSGHGCTPSHVFWVVLQTCDELFHLFALKADLVDCRKQWKPGGENNRYSERSCCFTQVFRLCSR